MSSAIQQQTIQKTNGSNILVQRQPLIISEPNTATKRHQENKTGNKQQQSVLGAIQ
jgi:hypothetical protein